LGLGLSLGLGFGSRARVRVGVGLTLGGQLHAVDELALGVEHAQHLTREI